MSKTEERLQTLEHGQADIVAALKALTETLAPKPTPEDPRLVAERDAAADQRVLDRKVAEAPLVSVYHDSDEALPLSIGQSHRFELQPGWNQVPEPLAHLYEQRLKAQELARLRSSMIEISPKDPGPGPHEGYLGQWLAQGQH